MKFLKLLKPYTIAFILLVAFTLVQVAANLELPDYTAKIINEGVVDYNQDVILSTGITMLGIALVGGLFTIAAGFLASRIGTGIARDLREQVFKKVESFSLTEINKFSTSSLITRSTNDIQQIQTVIVMIFRMVLSAPITGIWAIKKAVDTAPDMTWIMALAVGTVLTVIVGLFIIVVPKFQLLQKLTDRLNQVARENLTGIRVIRAFNNESREEKRLNEINKDLTDTNLFVARATGFMQPMMMFVMSITGVAIVWFGSHLIAEYTIGIGDMVAFMQYAIQVIISFLLMSIVFIMIPRAVVSFKRVMEVLSEEPTIKDSEELKKSEDHKGSVEFKDVTFGYSNADTTVLENITFTANPGETTAIIGSTGSGKSTLINLIPRFYDALFGEILVDGVNIKSMSQKDLREKIGYVPQKAVILSGTVKSNISYGSTEITDEKIKKAAQIAQASEFIEKLPEKYETHIAQNGTNLSGGQKQRVSIARAIAKDPEIFIFDDTFSALDYKTETKLRHELAKNTKDKTVIVVAQRVNTIIHADKIIVLNEGKIVGIGNHNELIKNNEIYREIAKSQLSEEELKKYDE